MKSIQLLALMVGAVVGSAAHADTNAPQTFRLMGKVEDAAGQPIAGASVECYQQVEVGPFLPGDMAMRQRAISGTNGQFDLQIARVTTVVIARKPGLAPAWSQYWNPTSDLPAERLVLTPPTTLAGIVVDDTDKPVAGAEVWVGAAYSEKLMDDNSRSFSYLNGKPARQCFSTRTTADGRFRLEGFPTNAVADLGVSSPGKVLREPRREYISPETMLCRAGQADIRLVVEPAGSIEGKVVGQETGQPLAAARLMLEADAPGYNRGPRSGEPAQSGADGTFRIADVAAGTYRIRTTFGTNALPEWVADSVPVSVEAGQTARDVKLAATKGGFLEVTVLGKDDRKPMAQVNVHAFRDVYQAGTSSGANGIAILRLPPGEYQVSASTGGSRSESSTTKVETGQTNRLELALKPPPMISGSVRDPGGAPVPGLRLMVFGGYAGGRANETVTDASGRYELTWEPQRYGRSDAAFALIARDVPRNLALAQEIDEDTRTMDLRLEPGLIVHGRVEDPNGKPLTNASVRLHLWSGNMGSQFGEQPRTDACGQFEVTALPPDRRYSMDATAKGYGSANQQVQRDDTETNRVELPPFVLRVADRRLAGQVVDADDKPVGGANVYLYGEGQPNTSVRADNQGWFKYDQVCEGQVRLSVSHQNAYGNATADGGDTNVVIKIAARESFAREIPRRPSLKGKALPDLAALDLVTGAAPAGRPLLLCLFDVEQRPSRRCVRLLAEHHDALKQQGLAVIAIQAAAVTADSFQTWKDANPAPFPVGRVPDKSDKTKWASEVESLPWLILTDKEGQVSSEGFALDDLEAKIKELAQ